MEEFAEPFLQVTYLEEATPNAMDLEEAAESLNIAQTPVLVTPTTPIDTIEFPWAVEEIGENDD